VEEIFELKVSEFKQANRGVRGFQVCILNLFENSLDISAPKHTDFKHYGANSLLFHTVFVHVSSPINCTEVKEVICKIRNDLATSWLYQ